MTETKKVVRISPDTSKNELFKLVYGLCEVSFKSKKPILFIGSPGIGKSEIIYQVSKKLAKKLGREFVAWHELTKAKKLEVLKNPKKYYVLVDIKGSMMTVEQLQIPVLKRIDEFGEEVEWSAPLWAYYFQNQDSAGTLFIDEINMTPDESASAILFEIILQRKLGMIALKSKHLLIIAAGNDPETNIAAREIPKPLLNRFIVVKADKYFGRKEDWITFAIQNNIDPRVIAFVQIFYPDGSILYKDSEESEMSQITTPRSLKFLSDCIKNLGDEKNPELQKYEKNIINILAEGLLSPEDAEKFKSFIDVFDVYAFFEDIWKKPELYDKYLKKASKFQKITFVHFIMQKAILNWKSLNKQSEMEKFITLLEKVCSEEDREIALSVWYVVKTVIENDILNDCLLCDLFISIYNSVLINRADLEDIKDELPTKDIQKLKKIILRIIGAVK
jgi:hypothetical protein